MNSLLSSQPSATKAFLQGAVITGLSTVAAIYAGFGTGLLSFLGGDLSNSNLDTSIVSAINKGVVAGVIIVPSLTIAAMFLFKSAKNHKLPYLAPLMVAGLAALSTIIPGLLGLNGIDPIQMTIDCTQSPSLCL